MFCAACKGTGYTEEILPATDARPEEALVYACEACDGVGRIEPNPGTVRRVA